MCPCWNGFVGYFFYGQGIAVLTNGLWKEARVSNADIERALRRKNAFEEDPDRHTFEMELGNDG